MRKKILVIEDEESVGNAIKIFLEQENFNVVYLSDGIKDLDVIHEVMPDLILTDLLMPHLHGFDICKAIKEDDQLSSIPLMAMSAVYKDAIYRSELRRLGVQEFLEKPFAFEELLKKIEKVLGKQESIYGLTGIEDVLIKELKTKVEDPSKKNDPSLNEEKEKKKTHQDELLDMKNSYETGLPGKILMLEHLWEKIQSNKNVKDLLPEFRRRVHNLSGSGTTFGFKEISEVARQLELLLDMIIVEGEGTILMRKNQIDVLMDNMKHLPMISAELEKLKKFTK